MKEKFLDSPNYVSNLYPVMKPQIDKFADENPSPLVVKIGSATFDDVFDKIYYQNPCTIFATLLTPAEIVEC
jgi:hypothetical protein